MAEGFMITGAENIAMAQLLALRGALNLELKGMTRRGRPASVIVRGMGISQARAKTQVYDDLNDYIVQHGGPARPRG